MADLRKFINKLRRYNLKLNPAKCVFGVAAGKLLGFIEYLSTPSVLVLPELGRSLLLYLVVLDRAFGCVLGQYDETGRKEQAIYYLSKKFTPYEARMDPLKYIFQKPIPTGKLAKWQILLSEFNIVYVTQKAIKGQSLADYLTDNPVDGEYEPLKIYILDEEISFIGEDIHPDTNFIDPIPVKINDQPAYCAHIEEEADRKPWFHDIKEYLITRAYPGLANATQKRTLRRLSSNVFHSGGILYRRTPDLGLLRCVEGHVPEDGRKQGLRISGNSKEQQHEATSEPI
ncbi:uncharacterized protein [Nicotiana sylvestris]|uniref:uncharacterized protein n=1 Tax=Nicotiana sylvestris TaxID=4096 RepID=UPI00388CADA5